MGSYSTSAGLTSLPVRKIWPLLKTAANVPSLSSISSSKAMSSGEMPPWNLSPTGDLVPSGQMINFSSPMVTSLAPSQSTAPCLTTVLPSVRKYIALPPPRSIVFGVSPSSSVKKGSSGSISWASSLIRVFPHELSGCWIARSSSCSGFSVISSSRVL